MDATDQTPCKQGSIADEVKITDMYMLHGNPEDSDVGSLAERRFSPADHTVI